MIVFKASGASESRTFKSAMLGEEVGLYIKKEILAWADFYALGIKAGEFLSNIYKDSKNNNNNTIFSFSLKVLCLYF